MSEKSPEKDPPEDGLIEVIDFDWMDFFERINENVPDKKIISGVPDSAFQHVEASLDSGVKEGFVVEYQWDEKNNLYWLAIVESVFGPLLKLTSVGEGSQAGEIWHDLSKKRLYPLGWCQMNKFDLIPPENIRRECAEWETLALQYLEDVTYDTISMHHIDGEGVTATDRFKVGMLLELQDTENPHHFWPMSIKQNRGSFLTMNYVKFDDHEETIFYLSPKLFPKGFAAQKEGCSYQIPSNLKRQNVTGASLEGFDASKLEGLSAPEGLITPKFPDKHKFEAGFHLEMIHPVTFRSLERFVVESVIDDLYFVVSSVVEPDLRRVTSMLDPTIFPCGTFKSLRSVVCANDTNSRGKVVQKRNFPELKSAEELGFVDRQKLEVYDGCRFRTATIVETKNHLLVLELDGGSQTKTHLFKSAHSLDIFPLGWCSTNGIPLTIPKSFLPETPEPEPVEAESQPIKPEVEEPAVSSWCSKVFFNYKCYSASFLSKARLASLPKAIGPGPVNLVLRTVLNHLIGSSFKSGSVLKRLEVKDDATLRQFFVVEEFKGKSRVLNLKANVELPTRQDQVDPYLVEVCKKLGACPNLVSTKLFEDVCPEDCQSRPKCEFDVHPKPAAASHSSSQTSGVTSKPKTTMTRKRKHPDTHIAEKSSGQNSTSPTDEDSDLTPTTSRASSPNNEVRKRGRLARGAKLKKYPEIKRKFLPPQRIGPIARVQQQQREELDRSNRKSCAVEDDESEENEETSEETDESGSEADGRNDPPPVRQLKLLSNPEFWSPLDTARYLAQTTDCRHLAQLMVDEAIDGQAFLLLNYSTVKDHWQLKTMTAIQLCQHIESVRLAHVTQF